MEFKRYTSEDHLPFISVKTLLGEFLLTLITEKHVYFTNPEEGDENGCVIMFWNTKGLPLLSNNYFAYVGYTEALADEEHIWRSDQLKEDMQQDWFKEWMEELKAA